MNIKDSVYESLTSRQRVIATIEAEARGDDDEVRRLRDTCPKKNYLQTDAAYTDMMMRLIILTLSVEADIRGNTIGVLISVIMDHDDALHVFLKRIANIQEAWHQMLEELGIDSNSMKKFGPPGSILTELIYTLIPEPDLESIPEIRKSMSELLSME